MAGAVLPPPPPPPPAAAAAAVTSLLARLPPARLLTQPHARLQHKQTPRKAFYTVAGWSCCWACSPSACSRCSCGSRCTWTPSPRSTLHYLSASLPHELCNAFCEDRELIGLLAASAREAEQQGHDAAVRGLERDVEQLVRVVGPCKALDRWWQGCTCRWCRARPGRGSSRSYRRRSGGGAEAAAAGGRVGVRAGWGGSGDGREGVAPLQLVVGFEEAGALVAGR